MFRDSRAAADVEEDVADLLALAWERWTRDDRDGRRHLRSPEIIARQAAYSMLHCNRRLGRCAPRDILDRRTQERARVVVEWLQTEDGHTESAAGKSALDTREGNPADLACARLMYAELVCQLSAREQAFLDARLRKELVREFARNYGVAESTAWFTQACLREKTIALYPDL
jgi:hypothetical protein